MLNKQEKESQNMLKIYVLDRMWNQLESEQNKIKHIKQKKI